MTINDAIKKVLLQESAPLTVRDIHAKIVEHKYYEFKSKSPVSIVGAQLRRHCEGRASKEATKTILYKKIRDKYCLIDRTSD